MEFTEVEDEGRSVKESESESESEEYPDSEDEAEPDFSLSSFQRRIRCQFKKEKELEQGAKCMAEERGKSMLKMVEEEARKQIEENTWSLASLDALNTDGGNEMRMRSLRHGKSEDSKESSWREKTEKHLIRRKQKEREYMRSLAEEERRDDLRANGITNPAVKGKYKILQRDYHQGAFFMDEDEEVCKKFVRALILEDHFNKTIPPRVTQVKSFGRSGHTKYTHFVDQETTSFDSAWGQESAQNTQSFKQKGTWVREVCERPSAKQRKTT